MECCLHCRHFLVQSEAESRTQLVGAIGGLMAQQDQHPWHGARHFNRVSGGAAGGDLWNCDLEPELGSDR